MTPGRTIVGVAHDPGGARAVLPVLEFLAVRGREVRAVVSGPAIEIADREFEGIPRLQLADGASPAECREALQGGAALVSAAGLYNHIEHSMRLAARREGMPIVAVLDWWWMYGERFQRTLPGGGVETSHPDWVCAIDEISRAGLLEAGFPADRIVVTGAANLESSWKRLQYYSMRVQEVRQAIGVHEGERCAVFFSEPYIRGSDGLPWGGLGGYFREDGTTVTGYTSLAILKETIAALAEVKPPQENLVLCVKPHPTEHVPSLGAAMEGDEIPGLRLLLIEGVDPTRLCAAGDIFFGMASVVLIEAALTGKPVLSVQISGEASGANDPCMANRLGFTRPVYDRATLRQHVAQWVEGRLPGTGKDVSLAYEGAAGRIAETIAKSLV